MVTGTMSVSIPEQQPTQYLHEPIEIQETSDEVYQSTLRVVLETTIEEEDERFSTAADFIRITDEH